MKLLGPPHQESPPTWQKPQPREYLSADDIMKTLDPAMPEALESLLTEINSSLSAYPNWTWIFNIHHHKPQYYTLQASVSSVIVEMIPVFSLTWSW